MFQYTSNAYELTVRIFLNLIFISKLITNKCTIYTTLFYQNDLRLWMSEYVKINKHISAEWLFSVLTQWTIFVRRKTGKQREKVTGHTEETEPKVEWTAYKEGRAPAIKAIKPWTSNCRKFYPLPDFDSLENNYVH